MSKRIGAGLAEERGLALSHLVHGARQRSASWRLGVSMVELVLTLAIIGTLGFIAVPRFSESRMRHREENAARVTQRAIDYAVVEARRRTAMVTIGFNASSELVSFVAELPDGTSSALEWRGDVAGSGRVGGDVVIWTLEIDPHGRIVGRNIPVDTRLITALADAGVMDPDGQKVSP
jgi:type II secretory pathway pseudopilin PulG